jgi:membrane protease YdiL (CAAX protease family)
MPGVRCPPLDMEQTYRREKWSIVIAGLIFSIVLGPFDMASGGRLYHRVIDLVVLAALSILLYGWCYFDSLERNRRLAWWLRALIILLGVGGLFTYLMGSRGVSSGLKSAAKALGVLAVMALAYAISGVLITMMLDIPTPDI